MSFDFGAVRATIYDIKGQDPRSTLLQKHWIRTFPRFRAHSTNPRLWWLIRRESWRSMWRCQRQAASSPPGNIDSRRADSFWRCVVLPIAGRAVLTYLGVTVHAFSISGGILLFVAAMPMLLDNAGLQAPEGQSSAPAPGPDENAVVPKDRGEASHDVSVFRLPSVAIGTRHDRLNSAANVTSRWRFKDC